MFGATPKALGPGTILDKLFKKLILHKPFSRSKPKHTFIIFHLAQEVLTKRIKFTPTTEPYMDC